MAPASLAASLVSAQIGRMQLEIAGKMLRMEADHAQSAAATIESAQQNLDDLALLAADLGSKLDVSV
jgi:VCBS repeat-containing protein